MNNVIKTMKNSKSLKTYNRKVNEYKYMAVKNYNELKPLTYTILLKPTLVITRINGFIETKQKLSRGDYVICGRQNEKYGLTLEKILNTYDLGKISNKKLSRKGFKLSKKFLKKHNGLKNNKNNIVITPSWGGKQFLMEDDMILYELDKSSKYYGIQKEAFKKDYN
jgi:hypothetical protein